MATYTIKDLEKLSGIKAHTIRIWEKRYDLIHPERTDTNFRTYNDDQLKKILNISILNKSGIKISKIACLNKREIENKVADYLDTDTKTVSKIDSLIQPLMDLDEFDFTQKFKQFIDQIGLEKTMMEIIYPFMTKVGCLWLSNSISPSHEHFVSHIIRQKLIAEIDKIELKKTNDFTFLLFLPEHEMHELGLLFTYYILKSRGYKVIYLGQFVPIQDIKEICKDHTKIDVIVASLIIPFPKGNLNSFIETLSKVAKNKKVVLSGNQIKKEKLELPENFIFFNNMSQFIESVDSKSIFN